MKQPEEFLLRHSTQLSGMWSCIPIGILEKGSLTAPAQSLKDKVCGTRRSDTSIPSTLQLDMYKLPLGLSAFLAGLGSVVAHGGVTSIAIGGTTYQGYISCTIVVPSSVDNDTLE